MAEKCILVRRIVQKSAKEYKKAKKSLIAPSAICRTLFRPQKIQAFGSRHTLDPSFQAQRLHQAYTHTGFSIAFRLPHVRYSSCGV